MPTATEAEHAQDRWVLQRDVRRILQIDDARRIQKMVDAGLISTRTLPYCNRRYKLSDVLELAERHTHARPRDAQ